MPERFDEVELLVGPTSGEDLDSAEEPRTTTAAASLLRRALAFLTDLSLLVAVALALAPLLPLQQSWRQTFIEAWPAAAGIAGFVLLISYYYAVGCWVVWGKTIGGAIFAVKIVPDNGAAIDVRKASRRWLATLASLATAGAGFLPALLPSRRSMADRLSSTRAAYAP